MRLSTKSRYGTRAMLDVALNCHQGPVHLRELAERQELSMKYLEQIVPSLKTAGLLKSIRGANGGYMLAKDPTKISLLDIVEALEGAIIPVECVGDPDLCSRASECAVHDVWKAFQLKMRDVLSSQTLNDLAEKQLAKGHREPIVCAASKKK
jgi:Rrf2 family transcriptional regulator, cysteine metabolism repressor